MKKIRFDPAERNWRNTVGKCEDEDDIVMKNDYLSIFILEVKFKASPSGVGNILTRKKKNFNILFPEYKDYDQHWGLAATIIDEELKDMALENGLTVLQHKGGLIEHNPPIRPAPPRRDPFGKGPQGLPWRIPFPCQGHPPRESFGPLGKGCLTVWTFGVYPLVISNELSKSGVEKSCSSFNLVNPVQTIIV